MEVKGFLGLEKDEFGITFISKYDVKIRKDWSDSFSKSK